MGHGQTQSWSRGEEPIIGLIVPFEGFHRPGPHGEGTKLAFHSEGASVHAGLGPGPPARGHLPVHSESAEIPPQPPHPPALVRGRGSNRLHFLLHPAPQKQHGQWGELLLSGLATLVSLHQIIYTEQQPPPPFLRLSGKKTTLGPVWWGRGLRWKWLARSTALRDPWGSEHKEPFLPHCFSQKLKGQRPTSPLHPQLFHTLSDAPETTHPRPQEHRTSCSSER